MTLNKRHFLFLHFTQNKTYADEKSSVKPTLLNLVVFEWVKHRALIFQHSKKNYFQIDKIDIGFLLIHVVNKSSQLYRSVEMYHCLLEWSLMHHQKVSTHGQIDQADIGQYLFVIGQSSACQRTVLARDLVDCHTKWMFNPLPQNALF